MDEIATQAVDNLFDLPPMEIVSHKAAATITFLNESGESALQMTITEKGIQIDGEIEEGSKAFFKFLKDNLIDPYIQERLDS